MRTVLVKGRRGSRVDGKDRRRKDRIKKKEKRNDRRKRGKWRKRQEEREVSGRGYERGREEKNRWGKPAGWLPVAAPRGWVEDTLMIAQILRFRLQHPVKMRAAGVARIDGAQYPVGEGEGVGKEPSQE
ncbi:hypothetical protein Pcinc_029663 [Petrolisthes cinctipes]|uniref:Uncharacterized protein n=1 Tax=Petrolisthes cinctipes TaxID=88211 RepID=A0AAE1EZV6_PETCI|nr:hypothetical protein Pcinc_029663 [Petrolisthes cinctipes]